MMIAMPRSHWNPVPATDISRESVIVFGTFASLLGGWESNGNYAACNIQQTTR
jgi:hypothetical protein